MPGETGGGTAASIAGGAKNHRFFHVSDAFDAGRYSIERDVYGSAEASLVIFMYGAYINYGSSIAECLFEFIGPKKSEHSLWFVGGSKESTNFSEDIGERFWVLG